MTNSCTQGVTKRCRLSLLTNSALVYESKCDICVGIGGWGGGGCGVSANEYSCAYHVSGAQINFGDLPQYLTYGCSYLYWYWPIASTQYSRSDLLERRGIILYLEYHNVCHLVLIDSPAPSPASECPPPETNGGGGATLACGWGGEGSHFGRLERKPGTLSNLCARVKETYCWRGCHHWMFTSVFTAVWLDDDIEEGRDQCKY